MKLNYELFLLQEARQDMEKHKLEPSSSTKIIADGKLHEYYVSHQGKTIKAYYEANIDNFGGKWPVLNINYGDQYGNRYSYTVSTYELITN